MVCKGGYYLRLYEIINIITDYVPVKFYFTQPAITCSKLTIETLGQGVK